jgi:hypothetical protein
MFPRTFSWRLSVQKEGLKRKARIQPCNFFLKEYRTPSPLALQPSRPRPFSLQVLQSCSPPALYSSIPSSLKPFNHSALYPSIPSSLIHSSPSNPQAFQTSSLFYNVHEKLNCQPVKQIFTHYVSLQSFLSFKLQFLCGIDPYRIGTVFGCRLPVSLPPLPPPPPPTIFNHCHIRPSSPEADAIWLCA